MFVVDVGLFLKKNVPQAINPEGAKVKKVNPTSGMDRRFKRKGLERRSVDGISMGRRRKKEGGQRV